MAAGTVTICNGAYEELMDNANTQWDTNPAAGDFMALLMYATHTPLVTDSTVADLGVAGTDWINTGDGDAVNITTRAVTATGATTGLLSDTINFGASVTITAAKWMVIVRPVTPGTVASTSKLIAFVELESGSTVSSTAAAFTVAQPSGGWLKFNQP